MIGFTVLAAFGANLLLALAALLKGSVSRGGAAAGFLTGFIIYLAGGLFFWLILGGFFVSSSLLSGLGKRRKSGLSRLHAKGSRRDAVQVLANGGVGGAAALFFLHEPGPAALAAFLASFAAASADTWASELGVLAKGSPRSILTLKPVVRGTSGGVSFPGTLASLAGALFIALLAAGWILWGPSAASRGCSFLPGLIVIVTAAGFTGSLVDSLLGAGVQARYRDSSGMLTERASSEGGSHELVKGFGWINNDAVNFLSIGAAAVLAWLLALIFVPTG
jgi:uncharacterized protein (TIGR00297 family)